MKYQIRFWLTMTTVTICISCFAQEAKATVVPISFENPTYSTTFTHDGLPAGTLNMQNGWDNYGSRSVGAITVSAATPISGTQSLSLPGASTVRGQATDLLMDSALNVVTPISMSWLVRVDQLPGEGGNAAAARFETGATINRTDLNGAGVLFVVVFTKVGGFQYLGNNLGAYLDLPGAYSLNTVYRVEVNNINSNGGGTFGTYDLNIVDTTTSMSVAGASGLALQNAVGTVGVSFFTQQRWVSGLAFVDDITAAGLPKHPGDFDIDGDVDGADFAAWQTNFPTATEATLNRGDADGDGDVDGADFVVWQTNFPFTPSSSVTSIPEPETFILICFSIIGLLTNRRRVGGF